MVEEKRTFGLSLTASFLRSSREFFDTDQNFQVTVSWVEFLNMLYKQKVQLFPPPSSIGKVIITLCHCCKTNPVIYNCTTEKMALLKTGEGLHLLGCAKWNSSASQHNIWLSMCSGMSILYHPFGKVIPSYVPFPTNL